MGERKAVRKRIMHYKGDDEQKIKRQFNYMRINIRCTIQEKEAAEQKRAAVSTAAP